MTFSKSSWLSLECSSGILLSPVVISCECHREKRNSTGTCVRLFAGIITRPRERKKKRKRVMATWHRRPFFSFVCL